MRYRATRDRVRFIEGRARLVRAELPLLARSATSCATGCGVGASTPRGPRPARAEGRSSRGSSARTPTTRTRSSRSLLGLTLEPDDAASDPRAEPRERPARRRSRSSPSSSAGSPRSSRSASSSRTSTGPTSRRSSCSRSCCGSTEEAAVGLVFLYRTEREHRSWRLGERARQRYPHRYREIELRPLPDRREPALVDGAADGELPEAVAELLAERAGGNPFFLEEALRDLVERGALRRENGGWKLAVGVGRARRPDARPGSAAGAARPARPGDARGASASRPSSGARSACRCSSSSSRTTSSRRRSPSSSGSTSIVEKRRRPAPEYRFRHGLVQEVAYATPGRADAPQAAPPRRRGARGALPGVAGARSTGCSPATSARRTSRRRPSTYLLKAGDAARRDLRRPGGARALPPGARLPRPPRRRAPRARHALQDGARAPPGVRLRAAPRRPTTRRSAAASRTRRACEPTERARDGALVPPDELSPGRRLHDRGRQFARAPLPRAC